MSGMAFALDVAKWCEKANKKVDTVCRVIVFKVYSGVVEKTPVWSGPGHTGGYARGNWQIAINNMPRGTVSGGGSAPKMDSIPQVAGNIIWIANNTPYIGVLEYGGFPNPPKAGTGRTSGGYSTQAPSGMVRLTVQAVNSSVSKYISNLGA